MIASGSGNYFVASPDSNLPTLIISRASIATNSAFQNGEKATYSFTISNPKTITLVAGYIVTMTIPIFNGIPLVVYDCSSGSTQISSWTQSSQIITFSLTSGGAADPINFTMIIENPISMQPVSFSAMVSESDSTYQIYSASKSTTNTMANYIDFTSVPSLVISNVLVTWTITLVKMTPTNHQIPINSIISIVFPNQFSISGLSAASITCSCSTPTISSRTVTVKSSIVGLTSIIISNIYNPGPYVSQSDQLTVTITDSTGIQISQTTISSSRTDMRYQYNCSNIRCMTCDSGNTNQCLSCYNDRSLQAGDCVASCSNGFYSSLSQCLQCINNCDTCSSKTVCLTCVTSFLFVADSSTCVANCSDGYYPNSSNCLICDSKCTKCTTKDLCQACATGFYKVENADQCVSASGCTSLGMYVKGGACVSCMAPCLTCTTSYNICASCDKTTINSYLQGQSCQKSCNSAFYSDGGNICQSCNPLCSECTNPSTTCPSCISTAFRYQNVCYATCPSNVPLALNGTCTGCPTGCSACTSIDNCTSCNSSYLLYKTSCVTTCPANYEPDSTSTNCNLKSVTTIIQSQISSHKIVPFPYILGLVLFMAIVFCSKNRVPETSVSSSIVGFGSFIELGAWITFFILQSINHQFNTFQNKLFAVGLIIHFLFNFSNFILYFIYLKRDPHFIYWLTSLSSKISNQIVRILSLIGTHKAQNILFSKFFGFHFFKAKLTSVNSLLSYNILSGMSLVFVTAPLIVSASSTCYYDDEFEQMFIEGIEVIAISLILFIFQILNAKKPLDYFMAKTITGINPLQQYLNNPLDKYQISQQNSRNNFYQESDRPEFKFTSRYSAVGELEKPLTFNHCGQNAFLNSSSHDNSIEPIYKSEKPTLVGNGYSSFFEMNESSNANGQRKYESKMVSKPEDFVQIIKELSEHDEELEPQEYGDYEVLGNRRESVANSGVISSRHNQSSRVAHQSARRNLSVRATQAQPQATIKNASFLKIQNQDSKTEKKGQLKSSSRAQQSPRMVSSNNRNTNQEKAPVTQPFTTFYGQSQTPKQNLQQFIPNKNKLQRSIARRGSQNVNEETSESVLLTKNKLESNIPDSNIRVSTSQISPSALGRSKSVQPLLPSQDENQRKNKNLNESMRSKSGKLLQIGDQEEYEEDKFHYTEGISAIIPQRIQIDSDSDDMEINKNKITKKASKKSNMMLKVSDDEEDHNYFQNNQIIQKVDQKSFPSSTPARDVEKTPNSRLFYLANPMEQKAESTKSIRSSQNPQLNDKFLRKPQHLNEFPPQNQMIMRQDSNQSINPIIKIGQENEFQRKRESLSQNLNKSNQENQFEQDNSFSNKSKEISRQVTYNNFPQDIEEESEDEIRKVSHENISNINQVNINNNQHKKGNLIIDSDFEKSKNSFEMRSNNTSTHSNNLPKKLFIQKIGSNNTNNNNQFENNNNHNKTNNNNSRQRTFPNNLQISSPSHENTFSENSSQQAFKQNTFGINLRNQNDNKGSQSQPVGINLEDENNDFQQQYSEQQSQKQQQQQYSSQQLQQHSKQSHKTQQSQEGERSVEERMNTNFGVRIVQDGTIQSNPSQISHKSNQLPLHTQQQQFNQIFPVTVSASTTPQDQRKHSYPDNVVNISSLKSLSPKDHIDNERIIPIHMLTQISHHQDPNQFPSLQKSDSNPQQQEKFRPISEQSNHNSLGHKEEDGNSAEEVELVPDHNFQRQNQGKSSQREIQNEFSSYPENKQNGSNLIFHNQEEEETLNQFDQISESPKQEKKRSQSIKQDNESADFGRNNEISQPLDFNLINVEDFGRTKGLSSGGNTNPIFLQNTRASTVVPGIRDSIQANLPQRINSKLNESNTDKDSPTEYQNGDSFQISMINNLNPSNEQNKRNQSLQSQKRSINDNAKPNDQQNRRNQQQQQLFQQQLQQQQQQQQYSQMGRRQELENKDSIKSKSDSSARNPQSGPKIPSRRNVDQIFDPEESVHSADEIHMEINEISPSDFNVMNQRYDEDFVLDSQNLQDLPTQEQQLKQKEGVISSPQNNNTNEYIKGRNNQKPALSRLRNSENSPYIKGAPNFYTNNNNNSSNSSAASFNMGVHNFLIPGQLQAEFNTQPFKRTQMTNPYGEEQFKLPFQDINNISPSHDTAPILSDPRYSLQIYQVERQSNTQGTNLQLKDQINKVSRRSNVRQSRNSSQNDNRWNSRPRESNTPILQQQQVQEKKNRSKSQNSSYSQSMTNGRKNSMNQNDNLGGITNNQSNINNYLVPNAFNQEYLDSNIDELMVFTNNNNYNNHNNFSNTGNNFNPSHPTSNSQSRNRLPPRSTNNSSNNNYISHVTSQNNNLNNNDDIADKMKNIERIYLSKVNLSSDNTKQSSGSIQKRSKPFSSQDNRRREDYVSQSMPKDMVDVMALTHNVNDLISQQQFQQQFDF